MARGSLEIMVGDKLITEENCDAVLKTFAEITRIYNAYMRTVPWGNGVWQIPKSAYRYIHEQELKLPFLEVALLLHSTEFGETCLLARERNIECEPEYKLAAPNLCGEIPATNQQRVKGKR